MLGKLGRSAVLTMLSAALFAHVAQAQVGEPQLPPSTSSLTNEDRKAITAYVQHWTDILKNADKEPKVVEARGKLMAVFLNYLGSVEHQDYYAREAAAITTGVLRSAPARLRQLKETNVAILFAAMQHPGVQNAYEAMVTHPNEAVRYLGWQGCREIRKQILGIDRLAARLLASLRKAAANENAPIVAEAVFRAMEAPELTVTPLPPQRLEEIRREFLKILGEFSLRWCRRVLEGDTAAPTTCQAGVSALRKSAEVMENDKEARTAILQMLADMLWCSSKAYYDQPAGEVAEANALLLQDIELALNVITGLPARPVSKWLNERGIPEEQKSKEVRLEALKWIVERLKPMGVKNPEETFAPKPTTEPAPPAEPTTAPKD